MVAAELSLMDRYRDGTPSFVPKDNEVYSNIWLSSYHSGWTFDHDDVSAALRLRLLRI